jgi:hypothetical protein
MHLIKIHINGTITEVMMFCVPTAFNEKLACFSQKLLGK